MIDRIAIIYERSVEIIFCDWSNPILLVTIIGKNYQLAKHYWSKTFLSKLTGF
jgi:hypothetical protein